MRHNNFPSRTDLHGFQILFKGEGTSWCWPERYGAAAIVRGRLCADAGRAPTRRAPQTWRWTSRGRPSAALQSSPRPPAPRHTRCTCLETMAPASRCKTKIIDLIIFFYVENDLYRLKYTSLINITSWFLLGATNLYSPWPMCNGLLCL